MKNPFDILQGDEQSKEMLIEILHTKGEKQTGLKEFIADLEEAGDAKGSFWVAVDTDDNPRGALTVRYLEDEQMSYLRSIWTRVLRTEDQFIASRALLDAWMRDTSFDVKIYQADLPLYSPMTENIQRVGFRKERILIAHYDVETDWADSELPPGYLMRGVEEEEMPWIYHNLVEPDLDPSSPIYLTEKGFLSFVSRVPKEAMESWVVVENEEGHRVGFAISFINAVRDRDGEIRQAVMFGPHSTEAEVQTAIIKEMMTYWKSKGMDDLRIVRSAEFYPSVKKAIEPELVSSTVRFTLKK
ncbi:MAG: hypothetical protein ACXAE3_00510 [Candidatus Kariarchaeaceae archaeon]|jgi:hypothetical protein